MLTGERVDPSDTLAKVPSKKPAIRILLDKGQIQVDVLPLWSHELLVLGEVGLSLQEAKNSCDLDNPARERISTIHPPHGDTLSNLRWTRDAVFHTMKQIDHHVHEISRDLSNDLVTEKILNARSALERLQNLESTRDISYPPV